jgi:hypothetical protein
MAFHIVRLASSPNEGLVKLLLACPVKGWFKPMERTATTDDIEAPHRDFEQSGVKGPDPFA